MLATSVFLGCQSSLVKSCPELNWRVKAESLALQGEAMTEHLNKLKTTCKKFATNLEIENFKEGFQRGLAQLCTTGKGFDYGATGEDYKKTCPDYRETNFLKGYYKGRLEFLDARLIKIDELYNSSQERVWRKEREYTIMLNQDPERAKLEADVLDSYREEARGLAEQSLKLKKEIIKTKRLSADSFF